MEDRKFEAFRAAFEAAARTYRPDAPVQRPGYRADRAACVFDLFEGSVRRGAVEYGRDQVDDFVDQLVALFP